MPEEIQLVCCLSGDTLFGSYTSVGAVASTETLKQRTTHARVHYYRMKKLFQRNFLVKLSCSRCNACSPLKGKYILLM